MFNLTSFYIIFIFFTALVLALFQYIYKSKLSKRLKYLLFLLRFLAWLAVLLLIINPKFNKTKRYNEKPTLVIALDNSTSINYLKQSQNVRGILNLIENNQELKKKFNNAFYTFGKQLKQKRNLYFNENNSNISEAINQLNQIYNNQTAPIILVTDGNQTYGEDYSYINSKQPIFPIIVGDTTKYNDIKITQVNANRYVYLKNKFPLEIIINYQGLEPISSELKIFEGKNLLFKQSFQLDRNLTSKIIYTDLLASSVGVHTYKAEVSILKNEKNIVNNIQPFAVEVIDQKSKIALVSDFIHPDLGAIKKAIEGNEQKSVSILKPSELTDKINNYQLFILYQPNRNFSNIINQIKNQNLNTFVIAGTKTDFAFLNETHLKIKWKLTNQNEAFQPTLNSIFNNFIIDDRNFEDFPPFKSEFGTHTLLTPHNVLLYSKINNISTANPLLATYEINSSKHAVLNGEGIWRWRSQTFIESGSFLPFDDFINKLVQYLSSNSNRQRLSLDYKNFYNTGEEITIKAQYFNKNFEFTDNASLIINIYNKTTKKSTQIPFIYQNNYYTVDLSNLPSGDYSFNVKNENEPVSSSGTFTILEFNPEHQFLNPDINKLQNLAQLSKGNTQLYKDTNKQINKILADSRFKTIQKTTKNNVSLIHYKLLLAFIVICLSVEWFIRKFNGLI